jgi:hypothetical protein
MLGGGILYGLAVAGGTVLLILPGIYLAISLVFSGFPIVLDRLGPLQGLRESHRLVKGSWWRTATLLTIAVIVAMIPYVAVGAIVNALTAPLLKPDTMVTWALVNGGVTVLCYAFVLPILLCIYYGIYSDLRLRKEGTDLEQRLEAVSA